METNKKRLYQKPEIQEVKLVPEEAVLASCKQLPVRGSGGTARRCNNCVGTNRISGS